MLFNRKGDEDRADTVRAARTAKKTNMTTVIAADVVISGPFRSTGSVHLDGRVEGEISAETLTVGEKGVVVGTAIARHARILGVVEGKVKGARVSVGRTARILGEIVHEPGQLEIEADADVEVSCRKEAFDAPVAAPPTRSEESHEERNADDDTETLDDEGQGVGQVAALRIVD